MGEILLRLLSIKFSASELRALRKFKPSSQGKGTGRSSAAHNAADGARLNKHLKQLEKYGKGGFKQLENGRFRYYGELQSADKLGDYAGARYVREWDPTTGRIRDWYESLDYAGRVRSVAPKPPTHLLNHHIFDKFGDYIGRR